MLNKDDQQPKAAHHQIIVVAHMMTPGVVQIPGDVSVTEAASLLDREQMPCLLVKDTDTHFGLMTPTDIVKKVVAQGLEPDQIEVRTIMTQPVHFIEYDRALDEATMRMMSTGTPILIVTKRDQPVGVLTVRDLVLSPKRCTTNIRATVTVMDGERGGIEHHVTITQLSHVGASLDAQASLLPGTNILVRFNISEAATPLSIKGKILNNTDIEQALGTVSGVDVQFTNLSSVDQSRIKAWVLKQLPPVFDPS